MESNYRLYQKTCMLCTDSGIAPKVNNLIEENLYFTINEVGYVSWSKGQNAISLASFIAGYFSNIAGAGISILAIVLGVSGNGTAMVEGRGKVNQYDCTVYVERYTSAVDYNYASSLSVHTRTYRGFEDADINIEGRPSVKLSEPIDEYYSQGYSFHNSFSQQVQASYNMI